MVELFEQDERVSDRQSSKGNQLKWKNKGIWYKADYTGYEGLAEHVISHLLQKSTLTKDEFVLYEPEQIKYKSMIYTGVKSDDFLEKDWQLITLERLFKNFFGESLYMTLFSIGEHEERLRFLVNQTERITGLKDFGVYLNKLFTIDAVFLNEDRHTHNIAVLMNGKGEFAYCPIFDHGAGLLSDTQMDYPMDGDVHAMIEQSHAKTICFSYDEQLEISEKLFGENLHFGFTKKDVRELLDKIDSYPKDVKERVEEIIYIQMRKYEYLFC